jgi:hypothetical protein
MSSHSWWTLPLRLSSGLSALLLTVAAVLYAPIGLGPQSPTGMEVRAYLLLVVVVASAAGTWILTIRPDRRAARLVTSVAGGFNGIWIFSIVGLPVVVASLIAIFVSAIGVPRRLAAALVALAVVGFCLGLLVVRLTEPPGEHILG